MVMFLFLFVAKNNAKGLLETAHDIFDESNLNFLQENAPGALTHFWYKNQIWKAEKEENERNVVSLQSQFSAKNRILNRFLEFDLNF